MFGLKSKASSVLLGVLFCSRTAQAVCYNMNAEQDSSLHECTNMPEYSPHLSCCPSDSVCLDNGLCLSPSNNSLELLSYQGCTWYSGAAEACPGAEYCRLKNATGWQYPKGTKWNIIPCPNGKYCCSVDSVSADCCAAEGEEGTFEVSFGRVRDSTTTSYQTNWVTTPTTVTLLSATTYTRTATETVCPTMTETETETLASDATAAAAASTVAPALAARFTA